MKTTDVYTSRFVTARDLQGGSTPRLVVTHVELEEMRDGDRKLVLYFDRGSRGFPLNRTNCAAMEAITGSQETDDWIGAALHLIINQVVFRGQPVPAVRIRAADRAPQAPTRQAPARPAAADPFGAPPPDEDIPF